ncbi:MAG: ABC transporter permease [Hyphomicrobiales bacterium]
MSDLRNAPPDEVALLGDDEAPPSSAFRSESYSALIRRRFRRSRTGVVGAVLVAFVLLCTVLADFIAPYEPGARDTTNQNSPPQLPHLSLDGLYTNQLAVELDPATFQPVFVADPTKRCYLRPFARSWPYGFLGLALDRHLLGVELGCPAHLLGTDGLGRDMLSRILVGSRLTLAMACLVVAISVAIGTSIGLVSGFYGGLADDWLQRLTELVLALPELPLYLAIVAIIPRNTDPLQVFFSLAAILSIIRWASLAREVRGKTLALRSTEYVRAAEAVGASVPRIVFRHVLPNVMSHVVVVITLMIPAIVLAESFLSFLGIGVQPPLVSWGLLLNAGKDLQNLGSYPWMLLPVIAILITVLGFNMLGDGLRDAIDPHAD